MLLKLPKLDMINVAKAYLMGGFFSLGDQKKNINKHYSLSNWFASLIFFISLRSIASSSSMLCCCKAI